MTLSNAYLQVYGQIPDFFKTIQQGQAPERFTNQLLKDWGYNSSNHRAFVPLLKSLGFLSEDGVPTSRYNDYRSKAIAPQVMAESLREAYSDVFVLSEFPSDKDKDLIQGKFKSTHNVSDRVAELMTKTFFALLDIADLSKKRKPSEKVVSPSDNTPEKPEIQTIISEKTIVPPGLHYNIQIHLPATKDVEVYNAIFKSLKEHLLG